MSYQKLDPALQRWAKKHGLHVYTNYKDEEVRSVDIVSPCGERFQLWIDKPENDRYAVIHVWDYRTRRAAFRAEIKHLGPQLAKAHSKVTSWSYGAPARLSK